MKRKLLPLILVLSCSLIVLIAQGGEEEQSEPAARKIPGITTRDAYPNGCVDCHINHPEINKDPRFSTLLKQWKKKVEPKILTKAQASAPKGVTLKGRHPNAASSLKNIPAGCQTCHSKESKTAPSFSRMMHLLHYTGGEENPFLTEYQGECTHCHKLNPLTGEWFMPSAPAR